MTLKTLTGMKDLLPEEAGLWQKVEVQARQLFEHYSYQEIRTPLLEDTNLFIRGIGSQTGVVQKEMYTFNDKGDELVTLRPEGTASVVRAYIEHSLQAQDPTTKLYYFGPMFRYERPQKGRLRQFHQIGAELLGPLSPFADAEVIQLLDQLVRRLGVNDFELRLNSLGCALCRPAFYQKLQSYLKERLEKLCEDCKKRYEKNPLRVFDCKNETCIKLLEKAPVILDDFCSFCRNHFDQVKTSLDETKTSYVIFPRMARGLDYYEKTAFELVSSQLGAQNAFAGGGRYDRLVKELGGPDVPGVGFAIGMERLILLLKDQPITHPQTKIYIAWLGEVPFKKAREVALNLRKSGLICDMDFEAKSLKAQLRRANKLNFTHVIILGEDEVKNNKAQVKNFATQKQEEVALDQLKGHFIKG